MTIWKDRVWTTTENRAIDITVWYHKSDDFDSRKFYGVSVYPITIEGGMISAECYAGYKHFLFEVSRKTKKSDNEAIDMARHHFIDGMIEKVCTTHNLKLED